MRTEIRDRLLDFDALALLIDTRFSWVVAPPAEPRPYIVAQVIGDDPVAISKDGPGRLYFLHVQFDCVAERYLQTSAVAAELINSLATVRGYTTTAWRFDNVRILERGRDDFDPPQAADEVGLHRRIVEVMFHATLLTSESSGWPTTPATPTNPPIPPE